MILKPDVKYNRKEDMRNELEEKPERVVNTTFTTRDESLQGKIMQLGHAFSQAVAEGDQELAQALIRQTLLIKEGVKDEEENINR